MSTDLLCGCTVVVGNAGVVVDVPGFIVVDVDGCCVVGTVGDVDGSCVVSSCVVGIAGVVGAVVSTLCAVDSPDTVSFSVTLIIANVVSGISVGGVVGVVLGLVGVVAVLVGNVRTGLVVAGIFVVVLRGLVFMVDRVVEVFDSLPKVVMSPSTVVSSGSVVRAVDSLPKVVSSPTTVVSSGSGD